MQKRHVDRDRYFREQAYTTEKYLIPFIDAVKKIKEKDCVLEVGCGEGGNLAPFVKMNCTCYGIDIDENKINIGKQKFQSNNNIVLLCSDIFTLDRNDFPKFDVIFLRDVIEHLKNHAEFMLFIRSFLKNDGVIFFGFPPWRMPFGGHQQVLNDKFLSKVPYFHLFPKTAKYFLKKRGLDENFVESLKKTSISINKFNKLCKSSNYKIVNQTYWLINPNYEIKFGLKPFKLHVISKIPYFRDFFTTCVYAVVSGNEQRKNYNQKNKNMKINEL